MITFGESTRRYMLTGPEDLKPDEQKIQAAAKNGGAGPMRTQPPQTRPSAAGPLKQNNKPKGPCL